MAFEFKAILEAHPHGGDLGDVVLVRHNVLINLHHIVVVLVMIYSIHSQRVAKHTLNSGVAGGSQTWRRHATLSFWRQ